MQDLPGWELHYSNRLSCMHTATGSVACISSIITSLPALKTTSLPAPTSSIFTGIQESTFPDTASTIVPVCQFKAPYQLSEVTDDVRAKMVLATANMLQVNASSVVLGFSAVVLRRRDLLQQNGVLVSVGLAHFYGSVSIFTARITLANINAAMAAEGLKAVQLTAIASEGI